MSKELDIFILLEESKGRLDDIKRSKVSIPESMSYADVRAIEKGVEFKMTLPGGATVTTTRGEDEGDFLVFVCHMDADSWWPSHCHPDAEETLIITKGAMFDAISNRYWFHQPEQSELEQDHNTGVITAGQSHFIKSDGECEFIAKIKKVECEVNPLSA